MSRRMGAPVSVVKRLRDVIRQASGASLCRVVTQHGRWARFGEHGQRSTHDAELPGHLIRFPKGCSEREGHRKGAWRAHLLGYRPHERDAYGRDPVPLEDSGEQSHGLRAHRSYGHEQRRIDPILQENPRGMGCRVPNKPPRRRDRAVEAQVAGCCRAHLTTFHERMQPLDRERRIPVSFDQSAVEGLARLANRKRLKVAVVRDDAKAGVTAADTFEGGIDSSSIEPSRRHEPDACLGQRQRQARPREGVDPAPPVRRHLHPVSKRQFREFSHVQRWRV